MMKEIKISHIVSFSSEDKVHKADHLLKPETYYKWKCATPGEKKATVTMQLDTPSVIHYIDIGNEHSAFVEILVKRSADQDKDFQALLVASSFMSPLESRNGNNANRVRMFDTDKLAQNLRDEKWDTVQIVCTQPFNKNIQYGLSFIKFHSPSAPSDAAAKENDLKLSEVKIGKFKLKDDKEQSPLHVGHYYMKKKKTEEEISQTSPPAVKHSSFAAATLAKLESSSSPSQNVASQKRKLADDAVSLESSPPVKRSPVTHVNREKIGYKDIFGNDSDDGGPSTSVRVQDIKKTIPKTPISQSDKIAKIPTDRNSLTKNVTYKTPSDRNSIPKDVVSASKLRDEREKGMHKKRKPFNKIMAKVVFVLSGFQNPFRSEIRDAALEMGAKYKADWDSTCTHLICAFVNTPKYTQVLGKGGRIVKKEWVFDCHKKKELLPWRKYMLGKYSRDSTTEEEEEEDNYQTSQKTSKGSEKERPGSASPKTPISKYSLKSSTETSVKQKSLFRDQVPRSSSVSPKTPKAPISNYNPKPSTETSAKQKSLFLISQPVTNDDGYSSSNKSEEDYLADTDVDSDSGGDTEDEFRKFKQRQADRVEREQQQQSSSDKSNLQAKDVLNDLHSNSFDYKNGTQLLQKPDTANIPLIELPNLFKGKHFFLYGEFSDEESHNLERYITAYNGHVAEYMGQDVKYVVTKSKWSKSFDDALTENDNLIFVRPAWIHKCHQNGKFVPFQPFIIVPDS